MKRKSFILILMCLVALSVFPSADVYADMAPPQMPPGANLDPGGAVTQVRMVAETVILTVLPDPNTDNHAMANTTATFTMRNLGTIEETMKARFPLSFPDGDSDGFGNFPEIDRLSVKVDGNSVNSIREMQPALMSRGSSYQEREEVPWAVFNVTFPPGMDVTVEVKYTVNGFGYYPYEAFRYVLETGAGWRDTIGLADIIVKLPYQVSKYNIWLPEETTGYSQTTPGAVLTGNEVRWHFEDLEPDAESNIEISLVTPSLWQNVLKETDTVTKNANDGEAWGRLGKAYKEIAIMFKGYYLRGDAAGYELFNLSRQAYENCLALLPNDSLWQYGYADLLWPHYFNDIYMAGKPDTEGLLARILTALKTSIELDPNNQRTKDMLFWISSSIPDSVSITDSNYDFLALTATPIPPTPYLFVTETPIAASTVQVLASPTTGSTGAAPTPADEPSGLPVCGGTAILLPILFGALWWKRKAM